MKMKTMRVGRRWLGFNLGAAGIWAGQLLAAAHPGHAWLERGVAHAVSDPWHFAGPLGLAAVCGLGAWLSQRRALRWGLGTGALLSVAVAIRWVATSA